MIPYDVNTPLFSDYATKDRFLWLPPATTIAWSQDDALGLPVGAVLIKTFAYLHDRRDPTAGRDLLETRLLIHEDDGWSAATYLYDHPGDAGDPTDATLEVAGRMIDASWTDLDGSTRDTTYEVPNQNQCKTCHAEHDSKQITPLGPKARHLNRDGLLEQLVATGQLVGAPPPAMWPKAPVTTDPTTGTLDSARTGLARHQLRPLPQPGGHGPHVGPVPRCGRDRRRGVRGVQATGRDGPRLGRAGVRHRARTARCLDPGVSHLVDRPGDADAGDRPESGGRGGCRGNPGVGGGDGGGCT